ncbi:MAG: tRNA glutamyl-Q(34) synthetase GluQRS [Halioglobus sp.]|nr:tRNA glutamyl-Q(34) synthetase GluQRS [Halioglobus sp.]
MHTDSPTYRGRFAPSPTGPLHLGSLIAALASYLDARHHGGAWLVRMEDLDPPREEPGAAAAILHSLQAHGLVADEPPLFQGRRAAAYAAALRRLEAAGHLFRCDCSRAALGPDGACRGGCRERQHSLGAPASVRVQVPAQCHVQFQDALQGAQQCHLGAAFPDFVLRRKDGLDAYQLAVVVDDCAQGITHVVRGSDLLDSTPRQVFLQGLLDCPTPAYCHLPVITNRHGQKFSKQNQAPPLDDAAAVANLRLALRFLGQPEPAAGLDQPSQLLASAVQHWDLARIAAVRAIPAHALGLDG